MIQVQGVFASGGGSIELPPQAGDTPVFAKLVGSIARAGVAAVSIPNLATIVTAGTYRIVTGVRHVVVVGSTSYYSYFHVLKNGVNLFSVSTNQTNPFLQTSRDVVLEAGDVLSGTLAAQGVNGAYYNYAACPGFFIKLLAPGIQEQIDAIVQ